MSTSNPQNLPGPNTQDKSNSAEHAPLRFALMVQDPSPNDSNQVKCTACERSQTHYSTMVQVVPASAEGAAVDPLEVLNKARRLKICTYCGTLSLTK